MTERAALALAEAAAEQLALELDDEDDRQAWDSRFRSLPLLTGGGSPRNGESIPPLRSRRKKASPR
jgi:hypothetical protein